METRARLGQKEEDAKNRKGALKDHPPGPAFGKTPEGKGKGTGEDKNGDPQVCFSWRKKKAVVPRAGKC